ncbi:hypothetical protein ACHAW6_011546 [Cyclotella cf. meneghiniana]
MMNPQVASRNIHNPAPSEATPQEPNSQTPPKASNFNDDDSLLSEASDVAVATNLLLDEDEENQPLPPRDILDDDVNAAPMHLHALRIPARLTGSFTLPKVNSEGKLNVESSTTTPRGRRSRSTSRGRPRSASGLLSNNSSRSTSPVTLSSMEPSGCGSHAAAMDHHSLDPDLLLDRLGFIDLDPPLPHEIRCGPLAAPEGKPASGGLTPVNERLSEETLEDCHAFTDLGYFKSDYSAGGTASMSMPSGTHSCSLSGFGSNVSVGSQSIHSRDTVSVAGSVQEGSVVGLGRLDEEEDEDEENDLGLEPVEDEASGEEEEESD